MTAPVAPQPEGSDALTDAQFEARIREDHALVIQPSAMIGRLLDILAAERRGRESAAALPDIEQVSAKVHEAWMQSKLAAGVTTRKLESGEELMVPYDQLSEQAKELDRGTVKAVYAAIKAAALREERT